MEPLAVLDRFAALEGEPFMLHIDESTVLPARLIEARELPAPAVDGRKPFTLLFRGPTEPLLPQRIYGLAHERLPRLDVFLVPVRADAAGVCYEAVFG